jgi:hypothetical protein
VGALLFGIEQIYQCESEVVRVLTQSGGCDRASFYLSPCLAGALDKLAQDTQATMAQQYAAIASNQTVGWAQGFANSTRTHRLNTPVLVRRGMSL